MLRAFIIECKRCGREDKIYFAFADERMRERMKMDYYDSNLTGSWRNCIDCFLKKRIKNTAKVLGKIPFHEADYDLYYLRGGMNIDFDAYDREAKENARMDYQVDQNEKYVNERIAWAQKKAGVKSTNLS